MRSFIGELRKRNVFRVAIAYCIIGWLVAQVAALAAESFGAPGWVMRMLLVVLLLGLPIALFLAWAFELTPEGMKRAGDVPPDAPKDPRSARVLNRIIIATLLLTVAALIAERLYNGDTAPLQAQLAGDKSIAVLPFADFSPGGDQGWFADGLTDEILNALARTNDLRVASRTSSFNYRNTALEIPAIAAELGVAHVLEGSVRRGNNRVRVTAQLIRAADDSHIWSETFDAMSEDAIAIQEKIALAIAQALQTTMDPQELERMIAAGTRSVEAWELYLRAQERWRNSGSNAPTRGIEVLEPLERAVALDPKFVDAQIALAQVWITHLSMTSMVRIPDVTSDDEARRRFNAAIDAATANARSESARLEYRSLQARAAVRITDAISLAEQRIALEPHDSDAWTTLLATQIQAGRYAAARETAQHTVAVLRADGRPTESVYQYLHRVDPGAALEMAQEDLRLYPRSRLDLYQMHRVFLYGGKIAEAASLADDYLRISDDVASRAMVAIRQACAEGRVADADALYASVKDPASTQARLFNNNWLYLKTLGRDDDALEELRPYDNADGIYGLSNYLAYTVFEPNDYPYLARHLAAQGITRPPASKIPFACKR